MTTQLDKQSDHLSRQEQDKVTNLNSLLEKVQILEKQKSELEHKLGQSDTTGSKTKDIFKKEIQRLKEKVDV